LDTKTSSSRTNILSTGTKVALIGTKIAPSGTKVALAQGTQGEGWRDWLALFIVFLRWIARWRRKEHEKKLEHIKRGKKKWHVRIAPLGIKISLSPIGGLLRWHQSCFATNKK
jgi:hypothetical protein